MIDTSHTLLVQTTQLLWERIEVALAPNFTHQDRTSKEQLTADLLVGHAVQFGGDVSASVAPV
jgi:hypothetical protein